MPRTFNHTLRQQLAKAFNGTRQLLFVTGEPGIGKTTLVETFLCGIHSPRSQSKIRSLPILPPGPRPPIPGLLGGSASSTTVREKPISRYSKPWDGCVVVLMVSGLSHYSISMRPPGWCRCQHYSVLLTTKRYSTKLKG